MKGEAEMSPDENQPSHEVIYETDDVATSETKANSARNFLKTKRGKIVTVVAAGVVLIGATAAAGIVGSNVVKQQDQGLQFGDNHAPGADGAPSGAFGYGPAADGSNGPAFGGPDGDHKDFKGKPPKGGFRPGGEHDRGEGPDDDGFVAPNGSNSGSDD
ncbi:MAG: hypothetical protein RL670_559 [Actinomycetota bacterium]